MSLKILHNSDNLAQDNLTDAPFLLGTNPALATPAQLKRSYLKPWVLFAVVSASLLLNACVPNRQLISCDVPELPEANLKLKQTDNINLAVHLDGTVSMLGYVKPANSQYKKLLGALDSVSASRWVKQPPQYSRFGTINPSIDRNTFLQAQLANFYQSGAGYEASQIEKIIASPTDQSVSLIVTDLYQKNADVQLVQAQLTEKYLSKGYAIGVLGIKSEFEGTIFDVGPNNQQFTYSTRGKKPEQLHPFYVLILGSHGNVSLFYQRLLENGLGDVPHQFSIFFPNPVNKVATLDLSTEPETLRELKGVKILNDGKSVVRVKDREPLQLLMATKKKDSAINFNATMSLSILPHVLSVKEDSIEIKPEISHYKSKSIGFENIQTKAFQLKDMVVKDKTLSYQGEIDTAQLDKGIYKGTFDLFAKDLQEPDWWSGWNDASGGVDGSKTNNLRPFLQVLKRNTVDMMSNRNIPIARVCYGVQYK